MIDFVLAPLLPLKPEELVMALGYRRADIEAHIRGKYRVPLRVVEQKELLGLGFAIHLCLESVDDSDEVLIVLGDTIGLTDLQRLRAAGDNVIALKEVVDPRRFGVAVVKDGRIVELEEKPERPRSSLAVVGLYYFRSARIVKRALAEHTRSGKRTAGEIQFTDALARLIGDGVILTPFMLDRWLDCGKRETMLSTNAELIGLNRLTTHPGSSVTHTGNVWVSLEAQVRDSALGPNVSIYGETVVEGSTLMNCIIGARASIRDCDLYDSLVGDNASLRNVNGSVDIGDACVVDGAFAIREREPVRTGAIDAGQ